MFLDIQAKSRYEFTSSGILCTNHVNCRDQLCVNLDTGELTQIKSANSNEKKNDSDKSESSKNTGKSVSI